MNEQLYSWTFNFHKVVRQHIWGEMAGFIAVFSAVHHWLQQWKNYWNRSVFAKVIHQRITAYFLWPTRVGLPSILSDIPPPQISIAYCVGLVLQLEPRICRTRYLRRSRVLSSRSLASPQILKVVFLSLLSIIILRMIGRIHGAIVAATGRSDRRGHDRHVYTPYYTQGLHCCKFMSSALLCYQLVHF